MIRNPVSALAVSLTIAGTAPAAWAHQPHDIVQDIALSPSFDQDGIAFALGSSADPPHQQLLLRSPDGGVHWQRMVGGLDNRGSFTALAVSPRFTTDGTLFATSDVDGVYASNDRGLSWQHISPRGKLVDVVVGLDSQERYVLLVIGKKGGVSRSQNFGGTWTNVLHQRKNVTAVALSPEFSQDASAVAGDDLGNLAYSVDGGVTWTTRINLSGAGAVNVIRLAPGFRVGGDGFVGTASGGLYRSTDGGRSFQPINSCLPDESISAIALSPAYALDHTLFVATAFSGVFKSTDGGECFTLHHAGLVDDGHDHPPHYRALAVSNGLALDRTVFLAKYEGAFRSTDSGESWLQLETIPQRAFGGMSLSADYRNDSTVAVARYGSGTAVSFDGAASWTIANQGLENPFVYDIAVSSDFANDNTLFAVHAYHVVRSTDAGGSWQLSQRLAAGNFPNVVAISPTYASDSSVFVGSRADGLYRSTDAGDSWMRVHFDSNRRFDSLAISPDFANDQTVFAGRDTRGLIRSTDGGDTWQVINNGLPLDQQRGPLLAISPNFPSDDRLVAATLHGLYGSTDGGDTWQVFRIASNPTDAPIEAAAFSPAYATDRTLMVSVRGKGLFRSVDGGMTWSAIATELLAANHVLNEIIFSPAFATDNTIYGTTDTDILRSIDRGESWQWVDPGAIRHEDNKPPHQWNFYTGAWSRLPSQIVSARYIHYTPRVGDLTRFLFIGTGVTWIGARDTNLGIADVYLDGLLQTKVDQYSPSRQAEAPLWSATALADTLHRVVIVASDQKNPGSDGFGLMVDAFDVTLAGPPQP